MVCRRVRGILAFAWAMTPVLFGQSITPHFQRLDSKAGLSQMTINGIAQDQLGLMWFATQDGLNRFDGYTFRIFRHDPNDPNSISSNDLRVVFVDQKGTLWVGTDNDGLNAYHAETESFTRYQHDPQNPASISANMIRWIMEDSQHQLWIATRSGGISVLDAKRQQFRTYLHGDSDPSSLAANDPLVVFEDHEHTIWVGHFQHGLDRFDAQTQTWQHFRHDAQDPTSLGNDRVWRLCEDDSGQLWIGTIGGGISILNRERTAFQHFRSNPEDPTSLSHNFVPALLHDRYGRIWVGTGQGGLNLYQPETKSFLRFKNRDGDLSSLSNNNVLSLLEDQAGLIWIGTYGGGINLYDPATAAITTYQHEESNPQSLSNNIVLALAEDQGGKIWIGSLGGGLSKLDPTHGTFSHYYQSDEPNGLASDDVFTLEIDHSGLIWIGTRNGGLNCLDPQTGKFKVYRHDANQPDSLSSDFIWDLLEDQTFRLWVIGYRGGLSYLDRQSDSFIHFKHDEQDTNSLASNNTRCVYQTKDGLIWVGMEGAGLDLFDGQTFQHFKNEPGNPNSLSANDVLSILEDKKGRLWIGTGGRGLNRLDRASQQFTTYDARNGLLNETVYGILADDQGYLWVSTNRGLFQFDPEQEQFTAIDHRDGLLGDEFNHGAQLRTRAGRLYFGGIDGLNALNPDQLQANPYKPPVVLTEFLLFNKPVPFGPDAVLKQPLQFTKTLTLSYADDHFALAFSALNFRQAEKNRFAYRMEGYDPNWIHTQSDDRKAVYTNLPAGNYVFQVRAANDDGVWNEQGHALNLHILPPWWKTWWAKSLWLFLLVSIGPFFLWIRLRQLRLRQLVLEREVADRTRDLREANEKLRELDAYKQSMMAMIVHDLKNPLAMILNHPLTQPVKQASSQMLNMVLNILDVQKFEDTQMNLNPQTTALLDLVSAAHAEVQFLTERKQIQLVTKMDSALGVWVDGEMIQRVLVNLLTNAIKFSPQNGRIEIRAGVSEKRCWVEVEDNGTGIPADQLDRVFEKFGQVESLHSGRIRSTGLGLTFCKMAIEAHGGHIAVQSQVGQGTTFRFDLPSAQDVEASSQPITPSAAPQAFLFSSEQKAEFHPFFEALNQLLVYETSDIEAVLDQMPDHPTVAAWKEAMRVALYRMDEHAYQDLIQALH